MEFSQKLRRLMDDNSLSSYKLAKELSVSPSTIANWLNGYTKPNKKITEHIAEYFSVEPGSLSDDNKGVRKVHSKVEKGQGIIAEPEKYFYGAAEVMACLGCKENKAYTIIRTLRNELTSSGQLTPAYPKGKIPKSYFKKRCMGEEV